MAATTKRSAPRRQPDFAPGGHQNPLRELQKYGQSVWLDYIRRHLITSGELQRFVTEDGLPVPGHKFSFGVVKAAQARGDYDVLAQRERRALRIHLGPNVLAGLTQLQELLRQALR
jgi:hypothetical protein